MGERQKKDQVDLYGRRFVAGELDSAESFAEIAQSMGAAGVVVDRLEDVGPALREAIEDQMAHGITTVIEVMCTRELGDPFPARRALEAGAVPREVPRLRVIAARGFFSRKRWARRATAGPTSPKLEP